MNSAVNYLSPPSPPPFSPLPHRHRVFTTSALRRHLRPNRRRRNPHTNPSAPPSDSKLQLVIDLDRNPIIHNKALQNLLESSKSKVNALVDSGIDAVEDLRTLITVGSDKRVLISCRRSTVNFIGQMLVLGFVGVVAARVLVNLGLGFKNLFTARRDSGEAVVTRRDRSLGGREVVVSKRNEARNDVRGLENPLSYGEENVEGVSKELLEKWNSRRKDRLPKWWPVVRMSPIVVDGEDREEYQKQANRLIKAIMDYRTGGKDIREEDIVLLRRICRTYGLRVFIDTTNSRDSLYRASVDFTLNFCCSVASQLACVQIDGEDPRDFIAGLAENLGIDNTLAARMVSAAVAARTRAWLLQAWALEIQGKRREALAELSKLCYIHQIFPPDEESPEMEMVARGLGKNLKVDQREYLMNLLRDVCHEENRRSLAEALGLPHQWNEERGINSTYSRQ